MNITKKMLAKCISDKYEYVPEYRILSIIDFVFIEIMNQLYEGNNVTIRNFGTFKINHRNERIIYHPVTGEPLIRKEQNNVRFVQSKKLKQLLVRNVADEMKNIIKNED